MTDSVSLNIICPSVFFLNSASNWSDNETWHGRLLPTMNRTELLVSLLIIGVDVLIEEFQVTVVKHPMSSLTPFASVPDYFHCHFPFMPSSNCHTIFLFYSDSGQHSYSKYELFSESSCVLAKVSEPQFLHI